MTAMIALGALLFAVIGISVWWSYRRTEGDYYGEWWHASGSPDRYVPKEWERRAYSAGLRDAIRITSAEADKRWHDTMPVREFLKLVGRELHAKAKPFENDGSTPVHYTLGGST